MDLRSHYPYWLMKNGMIANYPSLQSNISVDVAIVGAGISGALAAYYLTEAGVSIAVLDKRHVGMGSTAASTALLQYEIDTPLIKLCKLTGQRTALKSYKLCLDAIYELKNISQKVAPSLTFNIKPSLQYASYKKHKIALYEEYLLRKQFGFNVNWLEEKEIKADYDFSAPGAILSGDGGEVDAYQFTHKLLQYCIDKGQQVFDTTTATDIIRGRTGVIIKTETGCTVKAKKLVMACGYEVQQYLPKKVATIYSTYALVSEPIKKESIWKDGCLIWETKVPYLYFRIADENRILIGGMDDKFYNPELRDQTLKRKAALLQQAFNKKFPHIQIKADFSWAGAFASTKDGLPYIGTYPGIPNTYFTLGFGGNGITFSQIAARIITDQVTGVKNKDSELFSFSR